MNENIYIHETYWLILVTWYNLYIDSIDLFNNLFKIETQDVISNYFK